MNDGGRALVIGVCVQPHVSGWKPAGGGVCGRLEAGPHHSTCSSTSPGGSLTWIGRCAGSAQTDRKE